MTRIWLVVAVLVMAACQRPAPRCSWPNPGCDCWHTCGANWHPTREDVMRFGGQPLPTLVRAGAYLHWRACER